MTGHFSTTTVSALPIIIGAAVGDIVLTLDKLPLSGQDIVAKPEGEQIGGCGFNVARVLRYLELEIINGIPVGNGSWALVVEQEMAKIGLPVLLRHATLDNAWCIAFAESNGERTFVGVEGCEVDWQHFDLSSLPVAKGSIVYASGYELFGETSQKLREWLLALPDDVLRFVDPGPRLPELDSLFLHNLLAQNTILTLNQDEIALLCGDSDDPIKQVQQFLAAHTTATIIARLGCNGAWVCQSGKEPIFVPAYQVELVDSIGAGDAHCGGVIAGLVSGYLLEEAVRLGNKIAAIVVSRRGAANPPTKTEFNQFQFKERLT